MLNVVSEKKIYKVDSSVIISYLLKTEVYSDRAKILWGKILEHKILCYQPSITLLEISSAIKRRTNNHKLVNCVIKELSRLTHFQSIELNEKRLMDSIELSLQYGLKSLDSIYIQVANEFKTEFITFDKEIISKLSLNNYADG
ncbi:MAG: type II toxin-antitoxin system VapC family toxin [Melioribacteraceae bacterium]|nr:type II toxin-antitoxin system VapC family toxin [Melioribacteraceae bacterium]